MTFFGLLFWVCVIAAIVCHRANVSRGKDAYAAYARSKVYDARTMPRDFESYLDGREQTLDREIQSLEQYLATSRAPKKIRLRG